jgi:hypothetical protein
MLLSAVFVAIFYFIPGKDYGSYENPLQATHQVLHSFPLLMSILCSSLVIGPFNYFGTCLTKYSSAMHRCLIDASRMCVVWCISIFCGWEHFKLQQSAGYLCVIIGNLIYYQIMKCGTETSKDPILSEEERKKLEEKGEIEYDKIDEKPQNNSIFNYISSKLFSKKTA